MSFADGNPNSPIAPGAGVKNIAQKMAAALLTAYRIAFIAAVMIGLPLLLILIVILVGFSNAFTSCS